MKKLIVATILILGSMVFGQNFDSCEGNSLMTILSERMTPKVLTQNAINVQLPNQMMAMQEGGADTIERLDSITTFNTETQKPISKYYYTYNLSGQLTNEVFLTWNLHDWAGVWRSEYSYDSAGNRITWINYEWQTSIWINSWKSDHTFNNSGDQISATYYQWDTDKWILRNKVETDHKSNTIIQTHYDWQQNSWIKNSSIVLEYAVTGGIISKIYNVWSDIKQIWTPEKKYEYTYDEKKCQTSEVLNKWSSIDVNWARFRKTECAYDSYGKKVADSSFFMINNRWAIQDKKEYEYDANGNLIAKTPYKLKTNNWIIDGYKYEYSFDVNKLSTTIVAVDWLDCANKCLSAKKYSRNIEKLEWTLSETDTYSYSFFKGTSITKPSHKKYAPLMATISNRTLTLSTPVPSGSSVSLYDLSGRVVHSAAVIGTSVAIPSLARGIYVAEILTVGSSVVQKVRVE